MCNRVYEILSNLKTVFYSEGPSFQGGLLGFPKQFSAICYNFSLDEHCSFTTYNIRCNIHLPLNN
jgi:hypothetical protein